MSIFTKKEHILSKLIWIHPKFWLMNYSYSREWDAELRRRMESGAKFEYTIHYLECIQYEQSGDKRFAGTKMHSAIFAEKEIWVGNYPYAAMCNEREKESSEYTKRPSRATIYLMKVLMEKQNFGPIAIKTLTA